MQVKEKKYFKGQERCLTIFKFDLNNTYISYIYLNYI